MYDDEIPGLISLLILWSNIYIFLNLRRSEYEKYQRGNKLYKTIVNRFNKIIIHQSYTAYLCIYKISLSMV